MIAISVAVIMALHGNVKLDLIFRGVYFHFGVSGFRASAICNRGCPESVGFFKLYNPPTGHGLFAGREPSDWDADDTGHQSAYPLDVQTNQGSLYIIASPSDAMSGVRHID